MQGWGFLFLLLIIVVWWNGEKTKASGESTGPHSFEQELIVPGEAFCTQKTNYHWAQLAPMPTSCFSCHTQFGFISGLFIITINFTDFICLPYILNVCSFSKNSAEGLFSPEITAFWTEGHPDEKGPIYVNTGKLNAGHWIQKRTSIVIPTHVG